MDIDTSCQLNYRPHLDFPTVSCQRETSVLIWARRSSLPSENDTNSDRLELDIERAQKDCKIYHFMCKPKYVLNFGPQIFCMSDLISSPPEIKGGGYCQIVEAMGLRMPSNVSKAAQLGSGRTGMWTKASLILKPRTVTVTTRVQTEGIYHRCETETASPSAVLLRTHLPKVVWITCGGWPQCGRFSCNDDRWLRMKWVFCDVWNRFSCLSPSPACSNGEFSLAPSSPGWVWGCPVAGPLWGRSSWEEQCKYPHAPFAFLSWVLQGLIKVCKVIWNAGIKGWGAAECRWLPEARQLKQGGPERQRGSGETLRGLQRSSQLVGPEPDGTVSGSVQPQALLSRSTFSSAQESESRINNS